MEINKNKSNNINILQFMHELHEQTKQCSSRLYVDLLETTAKFDNNKLLSLKYLLGKSIALLLIFDLFLFHQPQKHESGKLTSEYADHKKRLSDLLHGVLTTLSTRRRKVDCNELTTI